MCITKTSYLLLNYVCVQRAMLAMCTVSHGHYFNKLPLAARGQNVCYA